MDAFELLKNDHKKVSELFKEIESASGQVKKQLFTQLKNELDVHAHIEERFLYPALENTDEAREITLEAYEEHKVVKDLLAELSNGDTPAEQWDARLKVLKENVEHHVEEEEGELFDKAEDALGDERVEQLGVEMEAEKSSLQGAGAPRAGRAPKQRSEKRAQAGDKPGVLKRLAAFVGLADSEDTSTGKRKAPSKSSTRGSNRSSKKPAAARKTAGKAKAARAVKSGAKSQSKTSKRASVARVRSVAKKVAPRKAAAKKKSTGGRTKRKSTR